MLVFDSSPECLNVSIVLLWALSQLHKFNMLSFLLPDHYLTHLVKPRTSSGIFLQCYCSTCFCLFFACQKHLRLFLYFKWKLNTFGVFHCSSANQFNSENKLFEEKKRQKSGLLLTGEQPLHLKVSPPKPEPAGGVATARAKPLHLNEQVAGQRHWERCVGLV